MATARDPRQLIKEAWQIAKDNGLFLATVKPAPTKTEYVLYRAVPGGKNVRLGKRSSPAGIRKFVAQCANFR
jgi:hypothetical protein